MAGLVDTQIKDSYKSVLRVNDNTNGIDSSLEVIEDGEGTDSPIKVSTTNVTVLDHQINTQYAYFGMAYDGTTSFPINKHLAIIYNGHYIVHSNADVDFGSGTDPNDTFTTDDTDTQYASQLVPMLWRVPDDITIDSVTHIEGADNATGDTTRMHLKSFTFTSGSTSCLTSGALLAHNDDVTNAGNEQAYLSTWDVDSPNVDAGKVILCFFRCDSVNSDYSINVTVKYHLR
jgi:hypothetical protein